MQMKKFEVRIVFPDDKDAKAFQRLVCYIMEFFRWESMTVNVVEVEKTGE